MKKESAIRQMFNGGRGHYELIKHSKEYFEFLSEVSSNDKAIRERLVISPELLELYSKTNDSIEAMHYESVSIHYVEGFKFGFLMGLDIAEINDTEDEK